MIKIVEGNLLEAKEEYICHQVNCQGVMGSGVALQIKKKYPQAYEDYVTLCNIKDCGNKGDLLGYTQYVRINENKCIVNLFGQNKYGYGKRQTSYLAIMTSITDLLDRAVGDIAIPYKMGCDRGGADWDRLYFMLEVLAEDFEYDIVIYKFKQ